jgi:hypothetical protein
MNTKQKLWSVNALSAELQRNPRTLAKALVNVPEDGKLAGRPAWFMSSAVDALHRYGLSAGGASGVSAADDWRTGDWPVPSYIAEAADAALFMLGEMAEATTVEQRRALYNPKILDAWQAAFRREHREMGSEFEAAYRPTQENGDAYYRALVAKLLAGGDLVPEGGAHD